jgi:hypothetical protein
MKQAIIFVVLLFTLVYCQDWQWSKTYHNNIYPGGWDIGWKVNETDDEGFLIIGTTDWYEIEDSMHGHVNYQFLIIRTDVLGNVITKQMYCDSIGAVFGAFRLGEDTMVVFNPLGILWVNQIGDSIFANSISRTSYPKHPFGGTITKTNDNCINFATSVLPDSGSEIMLYKLSLNGEILSSLEYYVFGESFDNTVTPSYISQTIDSGYIISGGTLYGANPWVLKINSAGDTLWSVHSLHCSGISSIVETQENEFLCISGSGVNIFICKIIDGGYVPWYRRFLFDEEETSYIYPYSLISTNDGNFVFCGSTGGYVITGGTFTYDTSDGFIMKIDSLGNPLWKRRVDIAGRWDYFYDVIQTHDSGYVCTGYASVWSDTTSSEPESLEVCLVKFSKDGDLVWENNMKIPDNISISVSPNPFNSSCEITFANVLWARHAVPLQIEIFDLNGKIVWMHDVEVKNFEPLPKTNAIVWSPDQTIPSGVYLVRATMQDGRSAEKRVVLVR